MNCSSLPLVGCVTLMAKNYWKEPFSFAFVANEKGFPTFGDYAVTDLLCLTRNGLGQMLWRRTPLLSNLDHGDIVRMMQVERQRPRRSCRSIDAFVPNTRAQTAQKKSITCFPRTISILGIINDAIAVWGLTSFRRYKHTSRMPNFFFSIFQWITGCAVMTCSPCALKLTRSCRIRLFFSKQAEIAVVGLQV